MLVSVLHTLGVVLRDAVAGLWVTEEEGIMGFSSGVRLRLEKSIEVPERGFDIPLGGHLVETHL